MRQWWGKNISKHFRTFSKMIGTIRDMVRVDACVLMRCRYYRAGHKSLKSNQIKRRCFLKQLKSNQIIRRRKTAQIKSNQIKSNRDLIWANSLKSRITEISPKARRRRRPTAERSDSKSLYLAIDASSGANSFETGFLRFSAFQFAIFCWILTPRRPLNSDFESTPKISAFGENVSLA